MAHHKKEEHHKKHREEHEKYARGGRTGVNEGGSQNRDDLKKTDAYTGASSEVVKEARDTKNEFKHGGKVDGKKHKHHMGKHHEHKHKFARGGRAGGNPFSSAYVKGIKGDAR